MNVSLWDEMLTEAHETLSESESKLDTGGDVMLNGGRHLTGGIA